MNIIALAIALMAAAGAGASSALPRLDFTTAAEHGICFKASGNKFVALGVPWKFVPDYINGEALRAEHYGAPLHHNATESEVPGDRADVCSGKFRYCNFSCANGEKLPAHMADKPRGGRLAYGGCGCTFGYSIKRGGGSRHFGVYKRVFRRHSAHHCPWGA
jgi:hypothetical protein